MFFYTQPIYLCIYLVTEHLIYKKHAKAIINHTFVTKQLPQQLPESPQTSCWVWVFREQARSLAKRADGGTSVFSV